jgi:ABC-type sulfate transport system substrate-binding protein
MGHAATHEPRRSGVTTSGWRRPASWLLAVALLVVVAFYGARAFLVDAHGPVHLVVYAFSTQEESFTQGIFPAFERAWEAETGQDLTIDGLFGASGTLAGQINLGAPADVAVFSNAEHVDWLKAGRRVRRDTEPVVVGCTPLVIVARPGTPFRLAGYADLAQEGLNLLHADPRSSGVGEWAVLAEYGSAFLPSADPAAAEAQLQAIWCNVPLLAGSARAAMTLFELGAGDALVTYEQDALVARERGVALQIVEPPRTIVARHVAVIVDDDVTWAERPVAEAFVQFLLSDAGQQIFSRYHLRPPSCQSDLFPTLVDPFAVEDLGGWSQAYATLLDALWQKEIEPSLDLQSAPRLSSTGEP